MTIARAVAALLLSLSLQGCGTLAFYCLIDPKTAAEWPCNAI